MPGILAGAGAVKAGYDLITKVDDVLDRVKDDAQAAAKLQEILKGTSIIEASQAARVEPITLVETGLVDDAITLEALHVALNAYAGFYVMTASLISSYVNGSAVVKTLDKLSPNRSFKNAVVYAGESHDTAMRLPRTLDEVRAPVYRDALEAAKDKNKTPGGKPGAYGTGIGGKSDNEDGSDGLSDEKKLKLAYAKMAKNTTSDLREKAALSIGKMIEINMGTGDASVPVFVNIRLAVQIADQNLMEVVLTPARNRNLKDRYHAWRAGELSGLDFVFMRDVVNHHRKQRMADTKGLRKAIDKRMSDNRAVALVSREGSLNQFSSIAVISRETARNIEQGIGGRLDDFKVRNSFFEENGLMMMIVVDRDYKMADLYYHSIPEKSELTEGALRMATKGSGPDLNAITEALLTKAAPSF